MSINLKRINECIAIATTCLIILGLGLSTASARPGQLANQIESANDIRILESGDITSLSATPAELAADRDAINTVFESDRARKLTIDGSMLRPYDQVMTVLVGTDTGFPLTMEIDLSTFRIGEGEVELEFLPFTLDNILVRTGVNELHQIRIGEVADYMTTAEADTHYFCQRTDGNGGTIIKATMMVSVNDYLVSVPVELRRDANQQPEMRVLSSQQQGWDWGISWFSSDCKKKNGNKCPSKRCKVTLKALLEAALRAGIPVPDWADTIAELLVLLGAEGISVGGECRPSYLFGVIYVGCQCWLKTLFTTGGESTLSTLNSTPMDF